MDAHDSKFDVAGRGGDLNTGADSCLALILLAFDLPVPEPSVFHFEDRINQTRNVITPLSRVNRASSLVVRQSRPTIAQRSTTNA